LGHNHGSLITAYTSDLPFKSS
jgi:hypothetical protein